MALSITGEWWDRISSVASASHVLAVATASVMAYSIGRIVYNLTLHPLAKYPGPKLAAATDIWWAYASTTGKYPWIVENALKKYGDVVRIAPNELVFITPQAAKDIYLAQEKQLELFVQVGYDALDTGDGGITGETNPVRHRQIAKKLAPAFSTRNLRAKETTIQKHIDLFVEKMKAFGTSEQGVELRRWSDWVSLDLAADMTYGLDMGHVRDLKDSVFLSATLKLNLFLTLSQITRKFSLLTPLIYLTIPLSVLLSFPKLMRMNAEDVQSRVQRREEKQHLDYFEQLLPANEPVPEDKKEVYHLQNVAGQLLLASWQPLANQFYSLIFFLLKNPGIYEFLSTEIREAFADYNAITLDTIGKLKYLEACMNEGLRLHQETIDGLPRISPGAMVDGAYIPHGVTCQISYFAAARSPRFFKDPLEFRPERWLSPDHSRFDPRYEGDDLKASKPFSQGPRGCPGGPIATTVMRLFMAKVLWQFDVEAIPGQDGLSFDKDFIFMTFWERPPLWVRFQPVQRS